MSSEAKSEKHKPIEELDVFLLFEDIADRVWHIVRRFDPLARDTVGKQMIRSADSINANLVEGDGRYSDGDALHFFVIARGSARELGLWLSINRELVNRSEGEDLIEKVHKATRLLNLLIRYRRRTKNESIVRESRTDYQVDPISALTS